MSSTMRSTAQCEQPHSGLDEQLDELGVDELLVEALDAPGVLEAAELGVDELGVDEQLDELGVDELGVDEPGQASTSCSPRVEPSTRSSHGVALIR